MSYDLVVIGGGPGGYVSAIKAAQNGLKTCIIEKEAIGGTCLNVGCIPTKVLLKSVEIFNEIKNADVYGITNINHKKIELDLEKVQDRKNKIVNELVGGVEVLLRKYKVDIFRGEAKFTDDKKINVNEEIIEGKNIIIATGSVVKSIPLETDNSLPSYTSKDILSLSKFPKKMVVIGGGVIGIELAYYLKNAGVEVIVVEFLDRILPMVDREISGMLEYHLNEIGIEIHVGSRVKRIQKGKIYLDKDQNEIELDCDAVLMAVGRKPNFDFLGIDKIGLKTLNGSIETNEKLETNIKGIYAIGDVNGKVMLAHTASAEGIVVVENILGKKSKINYNNIPSAIFTNPEIATIGLTEEEAREKYSEIKIGRFPMLGNAKAKIEGDDRGIIKIITEKNHGEIVGVHLYCKNATEMISEFSVALNLECTAEEIAKSVHPHPTLSEALNEAAHAAVDKAIHH